MINFMLEGNNETDTLTLLTNNKFKKELDIYETEK